MLAIVKLTYVVPLDEVIANTEDHRAYLRALKAEGKLIASGPFVPRTGGAFILSVEGEDELRAIIAKDPFEQRKVAEYDARLWDPVIGKEALEALVAASAPSK